jgi:hypothetical protein
MWVIMVQTSVRACLALLVHTRKLSVAVSNGVLDATWPNTRAPLVQVTIVFAYHAKVANTQTRPELPYVRIVRQDHGLLQGHRRVHRVYPTQIHQREARSVTVTSVSAV